MRRLIETTTMDGVMWYGDAFNGTLDSVDMALLQVMNKLEKFIDIKVYDSLTTDGVWIKGIDMDMVRRYTDDCCDDVEFDDYQDIEIEYELTPESINVDWFAYDMHLFHIEMYWTDGDVQDLVYIGR